MIHEHIGYIIATEGRKKEIMKYFFVIKRLRKYVHVTVLQWFFYNLFCSPLFNEDRPIVHGVQYWEVNNILGISKNGDNLNNEIRIFTEYQFNCSTNIDSVIVRGDLRTTTNNC